MIPVIVPVVIMLIFVPVFYAGQYFYFAKKQKNMDGDGRLYSSAKYVKITQIGAAVVYGITVIVGVSLSCAGLSALAALVPTALCFALSLLGAFDALRVKFNHVLMDEDGITLIKIYRKDKHIKYTDIAYYVASDVMLRRKRLKCSDIVYECYDSADNKCFTVYAGFESISAFTDKMTELDITLSDYPQKYIQKQRRITKWTTCGCFVFLAALFFAIFAVIFVTSQTKEFQNYAVRGTVQSCYIDGGKYQQLNITLKNDGNKYVVPYRYFRLTDKAVTEAATDGTQISMLIAYEDDGEYVVSQIEIGGNTYLSASKAQSEARLEDRTSRTISYIFLAIGIVTLVGAAAIGAKAFKNNKKRTS